MEFVSRLTEQLFTPGSFDTAFSTRVWQAAQLIPLTVYCFILPSFLCLSYPVPSASLHQLLQSSDQLVQLFRVALAHIFRDTGL